MITAWPVAAKTVLTDAFASAGAVAKITVHGLVFGKAASRTAAKATRAILPQPILLRIADALVAQHLNPFIDQALPRPSGAMVGARPGTQVLDISHGMTLAIERCLDSWSHGGVAQSDVEAFFDNVNLLRVAMFAEHELGLDPAWAATAVRVQLMPQVTLAVGPLEPFALPARSRGTLTGSKVAGAMSRIPVEHTLVTLHPSWAASGFRVGQHVLTAGSFVDNLFFLGRTSVAALRMAQEAEQMLATTWGLRIKPESRALLLPRGGIPPADPGSFPVVYQCPVLGHIVEGSGSTQADWDNTRKAAWRAFFANCAGKRARAAGRSAQIKLLSRAVRPTLEFRFSRWPYFEKRAKINCPSAAKHGLHLHRHTAPPWRRDGRVLPATPP